MSDGSEGRSSGRREVVVPLRLYKTVTVFSTLIAVVAVVLGFTLLDAATLELSLVRRLVVGTLALVGLSPPSDLLSALLAVAGLGTIAGGAGVYVLGTRFRTSEMGKAEAEAERGSDDG